jgi:hypothetical protein
MALACPYNQYVRNRAQVLSSVTRRAGVRPVMATGWTSGSLWGPVLLSQPMTLRGSGRLATLSPGAAWGCAAIHTMVAAGGTSWSRLSNR